MTELEVRALLRCQIDGVTQAEYAEKIGVSESYLSEILRGNRRPCPAVVSALGLIKRVTIEYVPKRNGKKAAA